MHTHSKPNHKSLLNHSSEAKSHPKIRDMQQMHTRSKPNNKSLLTHSSEAKPHPNIRDYDAKAHTLKAK